MSSSWIKMGVGLARNCHLIRIANRCGHSVTLTIGHIYHVWSWAQEQMRFDPDSPDDGLLVVGPEPETVVDGVVGSPGFAAAMIAVDWLRVEGDRLVFPRIREWMPTTVKTRKASADMRKASAEAKAEKKRAQTKERVRRHRDARRQAKLATPVTQVKRTCNAGETQAKRTCNAPVTHL